MLTREQALDIADAVVRATGRLPVEVAWVVPRRGSAWGAPIVVSIGRADQVVTRPRDVLRTVITSGGDAFALVHTHTTGEPPGHDDGAVTRRLVAAGVVVGVPMLAHLVVGPTTTWDCVSGTSWALPRSVCAEPAR